ncbi:hypothetical protein [Hyphomonas sp.]|jgi:CheY-like chemotaxis protein|uniref:hypothetical protein n=1 Tax=Hyphomonas sp. TaxID=87 RepID=UPI0032420E48
MKGVFIDDQDDQRDIISRLLEKSGIDFSSRVAPTKISEIRARILDLNPDIIVMDYRLDEVHQDGYDGDFRAGGLAQNLREAFLEYPEKDAPIVLLSTESNIRTLFQPDRTAHDLFDQWFLKDQVQDPDEAKREHVFRTLRGLITAYRSIKSLRTELNGENAVRLLLGLSESEVKVVQTDGLKPLLVNASGELEATHHVARQLLKQLILRPGILLDEASMRSRLGLSEDDDAGFMRLSEKAGFNSFIYEGVFSDGWIRYWRHRFNRWAGETFVEPLSGLTGGQRIKLINDHFDIEVQPAVSRWSETSEEYFAVACRVCNYPTEIRHSVAVFDPRPSVFADRGRVCFDCVDLEREMARREIRVEESEEETVRKIQNHEIKRPGEA